MTQSVAYIALVGISNAGKSTLLNQLVGAKVAIVTPKVQTTRTRVTGIVMHDEAQLVFVDTPGIFAPKKTLDRAMVRAAWGSLSGVDVAALVVDAQKGINEQTQQILEGIRQRCEEEKIRAVAIINKIDVIEDKARLLPLAQTLQATGIFDQIFMVSAEHGDGVADIAAYFAQQAQPMPWVYPPDVLSDMPSRVLAAEITREALMLQLQHELPYALTVETESWEEKARYITTKKGRRRVKDIKIHQTIYVQTESQKAIVVGKHGQRLKQIGEVARAQLGKLFERKVHLFLFVKVKENWQDSPEHYQAMGLE